MKALIFEQYGKAENVLQLKEIPEPEPGPGEVKVKMLMSPINPSDLYNTIEGTYKNAISKAIWNYGKPEDQLSIDPGGERKIPALPHIPGLEGVGVVVKVGSGFYPKYLMNKRVAVVGAKKGNWQQYNVVDAKQALPIGKGISDEQAAVSFVNPVTAYAMICEVLKCKQGDIVLQSAGNSEVGKMIIRMGKKFGYQTISIVRNKEQISGLKAIGANHVIDSSAQNIREEVFRITKGMGVKYALDPIAGSLASEMVQCLGLHGKLLVYGTLSSEPLSFSSRDLMTPLASIQGFFLTNWIGSQKILKKLSVTCKVAGLIKSGELQSRIHKVFPIDDFQSAIAEVNKKGNQGKILLKLN